MRSKQPCHSARQGLAKYVNNKKRWKNARDAQRYRKRLKVRKMQDLVAEADKMFYTNPRSNWMITTKPYYAKDYDLPQHLIEVSQLRMRNGSMSSNMSDVQNGVQCLEIRMTPTLCCQKIDDSQNPYTQ